MTVFLSDEDHTFLGHTGYEPKFWYRYEDYLWSSGRVGVILRQYQVLKETPKGAWLFMGWDKRFVRREGKKRFACPTIKEAAESFKARKLRQQSILSAQLRTVDEVLKLEGKEW